MRPMTLFAISGAVMLGGLGLSYAGTQAATAGLVTGAGILGEGESLTVEAPLDPEVSAGGVYALREVGGGTLDVGVRVTWPGGTIAGTHSGTDAVEERFAVSAAGTHVLEVRNDGEGDAEVIAAIGYVPGDEVLAYASAGSYVIIAGMASLAASAAIYATRRLRAGRGADTPA